MRANKLCAILGNVYECPELLPLTEKRPWATLPFDCKYRLIDFNLSNTINANVKSVYMLFNQGKTKSVFDHIGGGREWHLDSVDSRYFIHFYQDFLKRKAEGRPYFESVIDYLNKSKSEYTVFMGNRMLCNIDLTAVLKIHEQSDSELTVVYKKMPKNQIYHQDEILEVDDRGMVTGNHNSLEDRSDNELMNLSMKIFICRTDHLMTALQEGQNSGAPVALLNFFNQMMGQVKTQAYEYTGFLSNIFDVKSYYDANMDMLDPKKFASLLYSKHKVYTKLKNEVATYYSATSDVKNSQFATGCLVDGKAHNSLFSRSVVIEKDAEIEGSIVMANCKIQENAIVKYAILDKNVVVEPGVKIIGSAEHPLVVKKNTHVLSDIYGGE